MADIRLVGLVAGIFAILFLLIFVLSADVGYKIEILDSDIPEGTDATLTYEIRNNVFFEGITNVKFFYWIEGETNPELYKTYEKIESRNSVKDVIQIDTDDLNDGSYVIWTRIDYYKGGTLYSQSLSLKLTIY